MWKWLIGPALTGIGYAAGAYYGADAEQLVHKSPADVQSALEQALTDRGGTMDLDGAAKPIPYEVKLDDPERGKLTAHLMMDGRQGAEADVTLTPEDNGAATLVAVRIHADRKVLGDTLAGTSKARLAWAPDWMLNLTFKPALRNFAQEIESGEAVTDPLQEQQPESQADYEASLPPEQQKALQESRQYQASRPMMDPNAAAKEYMNGAKQ